jgi:hypothetical protein
MDDIRDMEGATSRTYAKPEGTVEVITLADGSRVIDRPSSTGPRPIETQRTTENGKSKSVSEVRFP